MAALPEVEAVAGRLSGPRYRFPSPPLRSEMDALVAERLTKTYHGQRGTVQALEAVDLTVAKGRLFGFLGRNGAGKTTFIKIAATLLAPTSGRVSLFGHDVVADPWAVRGDIALVPQEGRPFFHMSPREHVYEYPPGPGRVRRDREGPDRRGPHGDGAQLVLQRAVVTG